ncbi:MAG: KH domain-containing protein [Leptospiraceae bacterium]|nr:KH domain-containing protein [Leptospiraceae bacterium]MDW7976242.1 R3H domain-containing nucleic acid-binding protein [Leptospiraceae bacterium]
MLNILEIEAKTKIEAIERAKKILDYYDEKKLDIEIDGGILNIISKKPVSLKVRYSKNLPDSVIIRGVTFTSFYKLGVDVEIEYVRETSENFVISLISEESSFIIGKQGKNLDAFQFLINLNLSKLLSKNKRVLVDINQYREKRKAYLQRLARSIANRVIQTGKSYLMTPLSPYERRIIHVELEKDKRVTTESEGNGLYKRVRVFKIGSLEYKKRYMEEFDDE